ncbi:hypothetical protein GCM10023186_17600 [Hymenobacter koreensis]|uniref:Uncharacterized protein n=1 Tax=Hymenobacter koreensis TaxID=1084523 RepID=A0ABP8IZ05_9BACT
MEMGNSKLRVLTVYSGMLMVGKPVYGETGTSPYFPNEDALGEGGRITLKSWACALSWVNASNTIVARKRNSDFMV